MDKFDYKKEHKAFYQPSSKPTIIEIPEMLFIAVDGCGNPNTCSEYKEALEILYGLSFTIKMSKMNGTQPEGYFDYVVPPLEGLWYTDDSVFDGRNITDKDNFRWISMIRQPDFVTQSIFENAKDILSRKKPMLNLEKARLVKMTEGLCIQIMHKGSYDSEPQTIEKMKTYMKENGYVEDFSEHRFHHEIYLSNPRRCAAERLKTVIRQPIKKIRNTENES